MKQLIVFALILILDLTSALPQQYNHSTNPNSEYELINGGVQVLKPTIVPITRKPVIINTPPPGNDPNSKTFKFESNTWTLVQKTDPKPAEGTLLWNQNNDKWLTRTPGA